MTAIVQETGAVVAGANSFVLATDVATYWSNRGDATWSALTITQQETSILKAGDYLRHQGRFDWRGALIGYDQTMPWPRSGASVLHGPTIPSNVIPTALKYAQCELAFRAALADIQPDLDRGGMVKSKKVDVIETVWDENAPPEKLFPVVMGLLTPLLRDPKLMLGVPFQAEPAITTPFTSLNDFGNPGLDSLTEGQ